MFESCYFDNHWDKVRRARKELNLPSCADILDSTKIKFEPPIAIINKDGVIWWMESKKKDWYRGYFITALLVNESGSHRNCVIENINSYEPCVLDNVQKFKEEFLCHC
jgi:hypothetical protein